MSISKLVEAKYTHHIYKQSISISVRKRQYIVGLRPIRNNSLHF